MRHREIRVQTCRPRQTSTRKQTKTNLDNHSVELLGVEGVHVALEVLVQEFEHQVQPAVLQHRLLQPKHRKTEQSVEK